MKFDAEGNVIDEDESQNLNGNAGADGDSGVSDETERALAGTVDKTDKTPDERDASADALGDDPVKLKRAVAGLMKRMKTITSQRNSAREEARVAKDLRDTVARLEKAERDRGTTSAKEPESTPASLKEEERIAGIRAALEAAGVPVGRVQQMLDRMDDQDRQLAANATEQARGFLRSELEDHGIKITPELFKRWEFAAGSEMAEDPKLLSAYHDPATRQAAVRVAFERVRDGIGASVLDTLGVSKKLERVSKNRERVLGGGSGDGAVAQIPEAGPLTPPKGLKGEALNDWWKSEARKFAASLTASELNG